MDRAAGPQPNKPTPTSGATSPTRVAHAPVRVVADSRSIPAEVLLNHDIDPRSLDFRAIAAEPVIHILHEGHDAGDLLCAAHRIAQVASVLRRSEPAGSTDYEGGFHHRQHFLADGSSPVVAGIERGEDGLLFERYEFDGSTPSCRRFVLRVEAPRSHDTDSLLGSTSSALAQRLDHYVEAIHHAAESAVGGSSADPADAWPEKLATLVQLMAPTRIPTISATLQSTVFAGGHVEVSLVPRTPTRLQPAAVLRPAALNALKGLARPSGSLDVQDDGDICTYTVSAVRKVTSILPADDDPMMALRIHSAFPPLGKDPFTDAFHELRKALAR